MPIYQYTCEECGHRFDAWLRTYGSAEPTNCPGCGAPEIKRIPARFASTSTGKDVGVRSGTGGDCGPTGST